MSGGYSPGTYGSPGEGMATSTSVRGLGGTRPATAGDPATTVEDETTFGIAPAVGTDTEYARQDHTHGSPSVATLQAAGRWEHVTEPGSSAPPVDVYSPDGTDWVYSWVTD